ncbi:MAG TPA: HDOD domain-containing protein [Deltaproteobacteria bacterium]|nr:HDOD domain-containing protein [Deltaproteobacteria bacterium]
MRVLVVDDELVSREKMRRIMAGLFGGCDEASTGQAALEAVSAAMSENRPYELITLDISMPSMDGIDVLKRIRESERAENVPKDARAKIFMVTAASERETIITCIKEGCNDYITKPFSSDRVLKKLRDNGILPPEPDGAPAGAQASAAKNSLDGVIERFNRGEMELPPMHLIQRKFYELTASGATLAAIADLLEKDPAISSKLIRISNSSFYRGYNENVTVEQAVNRLGLIATKQTVDAVCSRALYDDVHPNYVQVVEKLWVHSLACAYACQLIAELRGIRLLEDPFTMGLFHDIGKLMLLRVIGELQRSGKDVDTDTDMLMSAVETHHGKAGAVLLKKWLFPAVFVQVAELHDDLGKVLTPGRELLVVQLANIAVKSLGYGTPNAQGVQPGASEQAKSLGVDPSVMDLVGTQVKKYMDEFVEYLS